MLPVGALLSITFVVFLNLLPLQWGCIGGSIEDELGYIEDALKMSWDTLRCFGMH